MLSVSMVYGQFRIIREIYSNSYYATATAAAAVAAICWE